VYATGFAGEDNTVYFLPDIYNEDKSLLNRPEAARKQRDEENKPRHRRALWRIETITEDENIEHPLRDTGGG